MTSLDVVTCTRTANSARWVTSNLRRTSQPNLTRIHSIDNSVAHKGLCGVYNRALQECQGEVVVFQHDDMYQVETGWDVKVLDAFAKDPSLGMLGVAGTRILLPDPPAWPKAGRPWLYGKVMHELDDGRRYFLTVFDDNDGIKEVVAIDGVWMAVRRSLFVQVCFDEENFPGFHFYDLDLAMQVRPYGKVAVTTDVRIKHCSGGHFGEEWKRAASVFTSKWQHQLPAYTQDVDSQTLAQLRSRTFAPGEPFYNVDLKGKAPQITLL